MYTFTDNFMSSQWNLEFLKTNMMGPNAMRMSEEMASYLNLQKGTRVLDLGCGRGLSTLLLVRKYGARVFAVDFWISPTENYKLFQTIGIEDNVIPVSVDVTKGLPFAEGYFDVLFSVDAYHYFGRTPKMLLSLIPFVKKGGYIAVAIPGWQGEFNRVPQELEPFFSKDDVETFRTVGWWKKLWSKAKGIEIVDCREMVCCKQAWEEWLTSSNPYAVADRGMMGIEKGKYFNLIQLIAKVS